jgi:glycosyltransferase domain-containing protein
MKNVSKKLTIIIPSYKRHKELKKKIEYLRNFQFKVLIIDGSPKSLKKNFIEKIKKFKQIKYFHLPTENRYERIFFAKKFVKTKYMKLEADNDYYIPSALISSINYLDNKKEYSAIIGKCGLHSRYKRKIYIKEIFKENESLKQNDLYLRMNSYLKSFSPALYHAVQRTNVFKSQIKVLKICQKKYGNKFDLMAEFCSIFISCIHGKVKNLNQITWIRADDDVNKRKNFIGIKQLIGKASNYQFSYDFKIYKLYLSGYLDNFFLILSDEVNSIKKDVTSFNKINDLFKRSIEISVKKKQKQKLNTNLVNILKFFVPSRVKKNIRFFCGLNGPALIDIIKSDVKVDYVFVKNELKELNKHLLKN